MQYFIFISGFFFLTLIFNSTKPIKEYVYIYYFIVILVALAVGLRGMDDEYTRVYKLIPTLGDFFSGNFPIIHEKGWVFGFISSFFKTLNFNSQSIFLFFSSTAVCLHAFFFRKYTRYYFLAFLLDLSHEFAFKEMNGLRMGFASALLLPMIYYLEGIVNPNTLKRFKNGMLNIHPAILPDYRGLDGGLWALKEGGELGVSAYIMNEGIDTGAIINTYSADKSNWTTLQEYLVYIKKLKYKSYVEAIKMAHSDKFKVRHPVIRTSQNRGLMSEKILKDLAEFINT